MDYRASYERLCASLAINGDATLRREAERVAFLEVRALEANRVWAFLTEQRKQPKSFLRRGGSVGWGMPKPPECLRGAERWRRAVHGTGAPTTDLLTRAREATTRAHTEAEPDDSDA
jgi:hypothetical protein